MPEKGSFKITFNPITYQWAMYGVMGSEYVNPENVGFLLGTAINNSYTNIDTPYFGVIGSTSGANFFDNLMISVNDVTPPFVLSTNPIDGDIDVAPSTAILIAFSEPMDRATLNPSSIRVSNGITDIDGTVTYQDATAIFTPIKPLSCSTTYTVNLSTSAADAFENPLPENYSWSFTTNDIGQCGCRSPEPDTDGDMIEDCIDEDDDDDGVPDALDDFPLSPDESIDTDGDGIGNNADSDDDGDGISDIIENNGSNNGDSNRDGTLDSIQDHIVSTVSGDGINYLTLELSPWKKFRSFSIEGNPPAQETLSDFSFPFGFIRFVVSGVQIDELVTVVIHLPDNYQPDAYFSFGMTPDNQTEHWYELLLDALIGAEINGNTVSLFFQDGKRGDDVQALDGMIINVGGPASIHQTSSGGGSGGGCFMTSILDH